MILKIKFKSMILYYVFLFCVMKLYKKLNNNNTCINSVITKHE